MSVPRHDADSAALTGSPFGLDPADDLALPTKPDPDPAFGENHAFWIFAQDGSVYINSHLNSIDSFWPLRRETITICLPGGQALVEMNEGWGTNADTIRTGGLVARCIEPMQRWHLSYKGTMRPTTQDYLAAHALADGEGRRIIVEWEADIAASGPPLRQGATVESWTALQRSTAIGMLGGSRYEQLFRADVRLAVHGGETYAFTATGTRTHRAGVRRLTEWVRGDWQSALFSNGTGFYVMRFLGEDDRIAWQEAAFLCGQQVFPAEILTDNWIETRQASGERMHVRLRSAAGTAEIDGIVVSSIFKGMPMTGEDSAGALRGPFDRRFGFPDSPYRTLALQQACVRYAMAGQITHGLSERSNFADRYIH